MFTPSDKCAETGVAPVSVMGEDRNVNRVGVVTLVPVPLHPSP